MIQRILAASLLLLSLPSTVVRGQTLRQVPMAATCLGNQIFVGAHTYHDDPFCENLATSLGGGCTQWRLFRDGALEEIDFTRDATPNVPPSDDWIFYDLGGFPVTEPDRYRMIMTYSRWECSGWFIFQTCDFKVYVNETNDLDVTAEDLDLSNWNVRCPLGSFDGANCLVMNKPSGGFVHNGKFYAPPGPATQCPQGGFDGANCFLSPKPAGGFIFNNAFYTTPGAGNSCTIGTFDGANCLISRAPWATTAFELPGKWYTTALPTCPIGRYDGANCLIDRAPLGTSAFEWSGRFYTTPRAPCS